MKNEKAKVKIIPLGGVNEIGKNLTAIEYKNDIVVIDCGLKFPDEDMFCGVRLPKEPDMYFLSVLPVTLQERISETSKQKSKRTKEFSKITESFRVTAGPTTALSLQTEPASRVKVVALPCVVLVSDSTVLTLSL